MTVELLHAQPETGRATLALDALAQAATRAGSHVTVTTKHAGVAPWLLIWGPGAPDRIAAMRRQLACGGHVVALDLAYWSRDRKVRVSLDAAHPQASVMRVRRTSLRWNADPAPVRDTWDPLGPIIVAGLGQKALVQYGAATVETWEAAMTADASYRYGRPVRYRRKGDVTPIDRALAGASLVVTWHSNVAVDAIRLGIPVVCRDGAAAAVCPDGLPAVPTPLSPADRDQFLANLAWFQWDLATEAKACWRWIEEVLE